MRFVFKSKRSRLGSLSPIQIISNFFVDTFVISGIYVILIIATRVSKIISRTLKDSPTYYKVAVILEHAIFYCGSLLVLLILLYITVISILELKKSFKHALAHINDD